jgi:hypothetical protein
VTKLGVVFTADRPPEELPAFATATEAAGLDELWVWEDCFFSGGISASATALAVTQRITVGFGVMPVVFRNPVVTAMEPGSILVDSSRDSGTGCPDEWNRQRAASRSRTRRRNRHRLACGRRRRRERLRNLPKQPYNQRPVARHQERTSRKQEKAPLGHTRSISGHRTARRRLSRLGPVLGLTPDDALASVA